MPIESFPAERSQLAAGKHVKKSKGISSYRLFIGQNGLVISTGRIQRLSSTAFETRHPKTLDSRHGLIRLFLLFFTLSTNVKESTTSVPSFISNLARPWWIVLDTAKKLESCWIKLDRGVSRKRQIWATQQRVELNKPELKNLL